ncbi:hypothetical protein [Actinoallomurus iriomotensis]|uniref:Uncharacterized protein n=1 Tax=Actinoallomurus iriomotensis TaxID=478107 RepID=A0A9W6RT82_9ACTN|nr:hypothetical protein [Actinoallomurus iriomotensis]GLY81283.1 hypothetical protein Airi01_095500 [Actinoallomurus iriomotensis]
MGDHGRSLTNDPKMLRNTSDAVMWGVDGNYLQDRDDLLAIEIPYYPESNTEFASDKDARTQNFSQAYSRLSYSLFRADQILTINERLEIKECLEKMANIFEATEDDNKRDVFNVKLPPRLDG